MCTAVLIGRDPANPPPPRIWAHIRGRFWQAKIDDISFCDPLLNTLGVEKARKKVITRKFNYQPFY
jgi:hypothetical protein